MKTDIMSDQRADANLIAARQLGKIQKIQPDSQ